MKRSMPWQRLWAFALVCSLVACKGSASRGGGDHGSSDGGTPSDAASQQDGSPASDAGKNPLDCHSNDDCPIAKPICDFRTHWCSGCSNDGECATGYYCDAPDQGSCVPKCNNAGDCATGACGVDHRCGTVPYSWYVPRSGVTVNLTGVTGSTSNGVYVVGAAGTILHYDATSGAWQSQGPGVGGPDFTAIIGPTLIAVGKPAPRQNDAVYYLLQAPGQWQVEGSWPDGVANAIVDGIRPHVAGNTAVWSYSSAVGWESDTAKGPAMISLASVNNTAEQSDNLFGTDGTAVYEVIRPNDTWKAIAGGSGPYRAVAADTTGICAVGDAGRIACGTASGLSAQSSGVTVPLYGVTKTYSAFYAVGANETVLVSNSTGGWRTLHSGGTHTLRGVWVDQSGANAIYAVGDGGYILQAHR